MIKKILCTYFSDESKERNVTLQSIIDTLFVCGCIVGIITMILGFLMLCTLFLLHAGDERLEDFPTTLSEAVTDTLYAWLWVALIICGFVILVNIYGLTSRVKITSCERKE